MYQALSSCSSPAIPARESKRAWDKARMWGTTEDRVSTSLSVGSDLFFFLEAQQFTMTDPRRDLGDYSTGKCLLSHSGVDYM